MTPHKIVDESIKKGLSIIAITDHNSAENTQAVITAAKDTGLYVIPGMEITTSEEIHIIGLFESVDTALEMQELVIVNKHDETEGSRWLSTDASELKIGPTLEHIHKLKGLAIAAHIDREYCSIISELGVIPPGMKLDALEISCEMKIDDALKIYNMYKGYTFITSSDSHRLEDVGIRKTAFSIEEVNFNELRMALKKENGRGRIYK